MTFYKLTYFALRNPKKYVLIFLLIVSFCIPGLFFLDLKLSGIHLESDSSERSHQSNWIEENFELDEEVIVYLERQDGESIFNLQSLKQLVLLTDKIKDLPEIDGGNVYSLSTEGRDRIDSFNYLPFLVPLPINNFQLQELSDDIVAGKIVSGSLISKDRKGLSIIVGLDSLTREKQIWALTSLVKNVVISNHIVNVTGAPIVREELGEHILLDLTILLPFTILAISVIFWMIFNSKMIVIFAFVEVISCIVFTFGLYGYIGNYIFLSTAILPIVLITICLLDELHFFSWFLNQKNASYKEIFYTSSYKKLANAIGVTTVTSSIGFLAFSFSEVEALRLMGIWAGVGLIFCLFFSLMVLPAGLTIIEFQYSPKNSIFSQMLSSNASRLSKLAMTRKHYLVTLIFFICIMFGLVRVDVQESWQQGFATNSSSFKIMDKINSQLFGTHVLRVGLYFDPALNKRPPLLDPLLIKTFDELESILRSSAGVGEVLGPSQHIRVVKYLADGRPDDNYSLPETSQELKQLWRRFELGRGDHRRREVVKDDYSSAIVNVYLKEANYKQVKDILNKIEYFHKEKFLPLGASIYLGGDIATSQNMIDQLIKSQLQSVVFAIASIFLSLVLLTRNIKRGFILVLPITISCLICLSLMGWLNIPLGVSSSIFLAICIGVGADFAIHSHLQNDEEQTLHVNYAILSDIVLLVCGFSIMLFSKVPANVQLGFILIASTLIAAIVTFLIPRQIHRTSR